MPKLVILGDKVFGGDEVRRMVPLYMELAASYLPLGGNTGRRCQLQTRKWVLTKYGICSVLGNRFPHFKKLQEFLLFITAAFIVFAIEAKIRQIAITASWKSLPSSFLSHTFPFFSFSLWHWSDFHGGDQIPDTYNLKLERFIWAHVCRGFNWL